MSRREWNARVFVAGEWCDFGTYLRAGEALVAAKLAWDELARHRCRPFVVRLDGGAS